MKYTDPWTGCTYHVTPSKHPDEYPIGHLGDGVSARLAFRHPDEQISYWEWQISMRQELLKGRIDSWKRADTEQAIVELEARIAQLRDPAHRRGIARGLLDHRTYLDKLTPRDRAMIAQENAEFRRWLEGSHLAAEGS